MKRGLDQLTAWVAAVFLAGAVFGGVIAASRFAGRHGGGEAEEGHGGGHGDEHEVTPGGHDGEETPGKVGHEEAGEEHGEEHGAAHKEEGAAHGEESGGHEGKAEPGEGEHEEVPAPAHGEGHEKKGGHDDHGATAPKTAKTQADAKGPHWDYKGSAGPEHWGDLSPSFKTCDKGAKQSPVDIDETVTNAKLLPIRFHYKPDDVVLTNNGHTVQGAYPTGNFIEVDGERFDLVQFHFHAPSEHKVSGIPYDLEMHLVHKNVDGNLLVVGVLFEEGAASKPLAKVWKAMPHEIGDAPEPVEIDPASFLPQRKIYYTYSGSLTTPPCSEGVKWMVLTTPETVSSKQVDELVSIVAFNARPVQPLKGRKVAKSTR